MLVAAALLLAGLTGDQTTLVICTLISAALGPVVVVLFSRHVGQKVDAVHNEVRPPSNGTTSGAILETLLASNRWMFEELMGINDKLGRPVHSTPIEPPDTPPPHRPDR